MATPEKQARERTLVGVALTASGRAPSSIESIDSDPPDVVVDFGDDGRRWFEVTEVFSFGNENLWPRDRRVNERIQEILSRPENADVRVAFSDAVVMITLGKNASLNKALATIDPLVAWLKEHPDAKGDQWRRISGHRPRSAWAREVRTLTVSRGHKSGPKLHCITVLSAWQGEEVHRIAEAIIRKSAHRYPISRARLELLVHIRGGLVIDQEVRARLLDELRAAQVRPTFDAISLLSQTTVTSIQPLDWAS